MRSVNPIKIFIDLLNARKVRRGGGSVKSLSEEISRKLTERRVRKVEVALSALPGNAREVANFLASIGIQGNSYPESCPVAQYIRVRTHIQSDVYPFGVIVRGALAAVPLPEAVGDFVVGFDQRADYIPASLRVGDRP